MTDKKKQIGIFGGSFNPINCGHIALAKYIRNAIQLDEIWFMVSPLNPFKAHATDLLDDDVRMNLARKALENEPGLIASDFEFHLSKPSYMWNTLQHLEQQYPDLSFSLIIGADNWLEFDRWYRWKEILENYHIIVYPRINYDFDKEKLPPNVRYVDAPLYPLSSTEVRNRIFHSQSIRGMVPENIEKLVETCYPQATSLR